MNKRIVSLGTWGALWSMCFAVGMLIRAEYVSAQALTPTGTLYPTFLPTRTAVLVDYPQNFACPSGVPSGYGTVTPNVFWEYSCGSCLNTPLATSTLNVRNTFTPTVTGTPPTPLPTSTPTGAVAIQCGGLGGNYMTCTQVNPYTVFLHTIGNPYDSPGVYHWIETGAGTLYFDLYLQYSRWVKPNGGGAPVYINYGYPTNPVDPMGHLDGGTQFGCGGIQICGDFETGHHYHSMVIGGAGAVQAGAWITNYPDQLPIYMTWQATDMTISSIPLVATPSPTPGVSYCDSIEGGEGAQGDPSLTWGGVMYGYNACVDIGGWTLSLFGVDYTFPLLRFCMQDVSFVNVMLFGVSISIDSILYVLVAAWAVRRMITS